MDIKSDFKMPANVIAVLSSYPKDIQREIMSLRTLIYETAHGIRAVGPLTETLKWGEPAYLTQTPKTGTTLRLAYSEKRPGQYGLYVNCNTNLIDTYRSLFPNEFTYEGNRAIIFKLGDIVDKDALCLCIAKALTYHLKS